MERQLLHRRHARTCSDASDSTYVSTAGASGEGRREQRLNRGKLASGSRATNAESAPMRHRESNSSAHTRPTLSQAHPSSLDCNRAIKAVDVRIVTLVVSVLS